MQRRLLALIGLALLSLCHTDRAHSQNWPNRTITIVVPLGAGGAMDSITRTISEKLSQRLGVPVIVDNRPGGGMVIGSSAVASAEPDGYTLMIAPSGAFVINTSLYKSLPYDPEKDFVPIAHYADIPFVLVVNPSLPVHSVKELIQYGKDNPDKLSYAASTIGAVIHLSGEMFKFATKLNLVIVPYKQGGPAALNDVVAGHVPVTFADPSLAPALVEAGKLRALGVSSRTRLETMPNVPTVEEAGVPGYEAISWHMMVAPAKTPQPIVDRLHKAMKEIIAEPEVNKQMKALGLIPLDSPSVDQMRAFMSAENKKWGDIVRAAGLAGSN